MEAALRILLPKIIGSVHCNFATFQGKPALLRKLPQRLRTYRRMLQPDWLILVIIDRDRSDCRALKSKLEQEAVAAGLTTRSGGATERFAVLNRIAVEELEAWYFGDWSAVKAAFPRVPDNVPGRAGYRDPDAIAGGTREALQRIMGESGYYTNHLPKVELAQSIAPHMDPARNISRSFQVLREALLDAARA